ncbi:1568_t:CDS:2 [Diversispora eburnea]|uniref:1568_t:CDS:1 n=1 Tax=Diversispora eburnea TaxID=1213867 RepID=A0A9N8UYP8_9GLOM|nr:1568_t:CDS:2 [Diversispora eburnea]
MDENKSQPLHVTGILVYRIQKQIEFLLLNDTFSHKKHWTSPKGVVIRQEDEKKCALRNTLEITGLSVNDLRIEDDFKVEITYLSGTRPKRVVYYLAQASDYARVYTSGEGLNFAWLSLNVATEKAIYKSMQEVIKKAYSYIAKKKPPKNSDPPQRPRIEKNQINSDRLDSRMKVLNLALPLDSQRAAISRQRLELVRERQQHNRPEKNGNGFSSPLHSPVMPFENPLYKTRLCERFETEGFCPYGPKCTFAHGTVELRERPAGEEKIDAPLTAKDGPDNPLYKTRLCERFMKENFCQYGPKCNFAHGEEELRERPNAGRENLESDSPEPHPPTNKYQHPHYRQNNPSENDTEKKVHPSNTGIIGGWRSERSEIHNGIFGRISILSGSDSNSNHAMTSSPSQIEETQIETDNNKPLEYKNLEPDSEEKGMNEERKLTEETERDMNFNHKEQDEESKENSSSPHLSAKNISGKRRVGKDIIGDERTDHQSPGDKRPHDEAFISDLKRVFSQNKSITEEIKEITLIETRKDLSKSQLFNILIPSLYDEATWDVISKDLVKREKLFKTFVRSSQDQITFLRSWEKFLNGRNANLKNKAHLIFKDFYDKDFIEEDSVLEWYDHAKDTSEVKKKCSVFITWLKNAEEEEE